MVRCPPSFSAVFSHVSTSSVGERQAVLGQMSSFLQCRLQSCIDVVSRGATSRPWSDVLLPSVPSSVMYRRRQSASDKPSLVRCPPPFSAVFSHVSTSSVGERLAVLGQMSSFLQCRLQSCIDVVSRGATSRPWSDVLLPSVPSSVMYRRRQSGSDKPSLVRCPPSVSAVFSHVPTSSVGERLAVLGQMSSFRQCRLQSCIDVVSRRATSRPWSDVLLPSVPSSVTYRRRQSGSD